LPDNWIVAINF